MNTELIPVDDSSGFSKFALAGAAASGLAVGILAHMAYSQRKARSNEIQAEAMAAIEEASRSIEAAVAAAEALDKELEEEASAPQPKVDAEVEAPVDRTLAELIARTDAEIGRLIALTDTESLALVVNFAKNKRAILADPKVTIDQVVQILTETLNAQDAEEGN